MGHRWLRSIELQKHPIQYQQSLLVMRVVALTKDATMGGTKRVVKYSVCANMAIITLSPQKAPTKPYAQTIQDGEGGKFVSR
jgi:hypothetical protein